jgi:hypothetical protein
MWLRVRFGTLSLLLLMALIAVCFGWAADHVRLQRQINFMARYEEMQGKQLSEANRALQYITQKRLKPYYMPAPQAIQDEDAKLCVEPWTSVRR